MRILSAPRGQAGSRRSNTPQRLVDAVPKVEVAGVQRPIPQAPVDPAQHHLAIAIEVSLRAIEVLPLIRRRNERIEILRHQRIEQISRHQSVDKRHVRLRIARRFPQRHRRKITGALGGGKDGRNPAFTALGCPSFAIDKHEKALLFRQRPADLRPARQAVDGIARPIKRLDGVAASRPPEPPRLTVPFAAAAASHG